METITLCPKCKGTGKGLFVKKCTLCKGETTIHTIDGVICKTCSNTGQYTTDGYFQETHYCSCVYGITLKNKNKNQQIIVLEAKQKEEAYWTIDTPEKNLEQKKEKYNKPNLFIEISKQNQILIDYDEDKLPDRFHEALKFLEKRFPKGCKWKEVHSASGVNIHVTITLNVDITDEERVAWQAVFGSDYKREAMNLIKMSQNIENPILFYTDPNNEPIAEGVIEPKPGRKFKDA